MGHIRTPYDELRRMRASGGLDLFFLGFGATPEVTTTIPVSTKVFGNLRPTKEMASRNLTVYHPEKVFVPKTSEIYVQNGTEYRIAVAATDIVYGSIKDINESFNKEFGYKNFLNVLQFSCDQQVITDGYFTLFLDANPRLQKKLPERS